MDRLIATIITKEFVDLFFYFT